jgi:exonuclease SbcD
VELGAVGTEPDVEWVDLPVPRRLSQLTGTLDELLTDPRFLDSVGDWVKAVLTDQVRPQDGMRQLHERFPFAVALEHRPVVVVTPEAATYRERVRAKTDPEIVAGFLEYVRNGVGPTEFEAALVAKILSEQHSTEVNRAEEIDAEQDRAVEGAPSTSEGARA